MHVHLMIIPQVRDQERDVADYRALGSGIGAVVRTEAALVFMLKLAVVGEYLRTAQCVVLARQLQGFSNFLQCQTANVTELLSAGWAPVVHPGLACRTESVAILAL